MESLLIFVVVGLLLGVFHRRRVWRSVLDIKAGKIWGPGARQRNARFSLLIMVVVILIELIAQATAFSRGESMAAVSELKSIKLILMMVSMVLAARLMLRLKRRRNPAV